MTDFHRNIFYYYSGAKQSDFERQWENNTTKALINVLEHCTSTVTIKFLERLGIAAAEPIKFELQRAKISNGKIGNKKQRLLLGLVQSKDNEENGYHDEADNAAATGESLPDAWIYGNDFVVLLESKVVGNLNSDQTQRQLRLLNQNTTPSIKVYTWAEIHQFFKALSEELTGKDNWIVGQFTQYLEYIGMAEFTGFIPEVFDYFLSHDDDDMRLMVRSTMSSFAEKVLGRLQSETQINDDLRYSSYHSGNLSLIDDHCWVAFFGPGKEDFRKRAHQTITVGAQGLDLFVNVELKPAVDRLRKKIHDDNQAFRNIVKSMPSPYSVRIEEREYNRPRDYIYHPVVSVEDKYIKPPTEITGFEFIEKLLSQLNLPTFMVVKHINRKEVLQLSHQGGDALIERIFGYMKDFHLLVRFINT